MAMKAEIKINLNIFIGTGERTQQHCQMEWLMPVISATQEVEIRRIVVQGQSGQKFSEASISTNKAGCGSVCLSFHLCRRYK
jgi:hypothetical protein